MHAQEDAQLTLFWCAYCERVSVESLDRHKPCRCGYNDCHINMRGDDFIVNLLGEDYRQKLKQGYTVVERLGGDWADLRANYHPEYPEVPEFGLRYSMPNIKGYARVMTPEQHLKLNAQK